MGERSGQRVPEAIAPAVVPCRPERIRLGRRVFGRQPRALPYHGRQGGYVHHAPAGVASVERALRAAQKLDAAYVVEVEVVGVLVHVGHVVYIDPDHGLVDARAESAHVYRGGHSRPVSRLVEVGRNGREILDRLYAFAFETVHARFGGGYRQARGISALQGCGNLDLFDAV